MRKLGTGTTNVGDKKCPVVDTWWQTETGGIMISPIAFVTPTKPTYASLPLPIQPVLMDENVKLRQLLPIYVLNSLARNC
jgi:acyl-coenzyme A synthetase/AMP-(fatty) acid ligase